MNRVLKSIFQAASKPVSWGASSSLQGTRPMTQGHQRQLLPTCFLREEILALLQAGRKQPPTDRDTRPTEANDVSLVRVVRFAEPQPRTYVVIFLYIK